jgi:hypothetical protein
MENAGSPMAVVPIGVIDLTLMSRFYAVIPLRFKRTPFALAVFDAGPLRGLGRLGQGLAVADMKRAAHL